MSKLIEAIKTLEIELSSFNESTIYAKQNSFSFKSQEIVERVLDDLKRLKNVEKAVKLEHAASTLNQLSWDLCRSIDHVYDMNVSDPVRERIDALHEESSVIEYEIRELLGVSHYFQ